MIGVVYYNNEKTKERVSDSHILFTKRENSSQIIRNTIERPNSLNT